MGPTATLPHEKYYNITAYEKRMTALKEGELLPPADDGYDPQADMQALRSVHKRKPVEQDSFLTREQLRELRKVQHERIEVGATPWLVILSSCQRIRPVKESFLGWR